MHSRRLGLHPVSAPPKRKEGGCSARILAQKYYIYRYTKLYVFSVICKYSPSHSIIFNIGPLPTDQIVVEPFPVDPSQDLDLSSTLTSHGMASISDVSRKSASTNPHARRNVLIRNINVLHRSFSPASEPHNAVGKRQVDNIVHVRDVSDSYNSSPMRPWRHQDSGVREVNLDLNDAAVNLELPPVYTAI